MLCRAKFDGQGLQAGQAGLLDGLQLGPVLLHHPLVVVGGDGGQTLRDQVVHGVAGPHFDHVALLAQVLDRLHQQQLDAAVQALRQSLGAMRNGRFLRCLRVDHR